LARARAGGGACLDWLATLVLAVGQVMLLHPAASKGTLTQIGRFPTEKTPRGFAIDPRGEFLLSVGMDSAGMTVYTIDQASGELKPIGNYPMGTQPNWIEMVDLK
jgi:6-phosphogluconolactonase (cycloisomerase 2 family)